MAHNCVVEVQEASRASEMSDRRPWRRTSGGDEEADRDD